MRTLTAGQTSSITGNTTLCKVWKVTLQNGTVLGFTNNSRDLIISGVTYEAATGFEPYAVEASSDFSVDNTELEGLLSSPSIIEADLMAGLWDLATVELSLVNHQDLTVAPIPLSKGVLGHARIDGQRYYAEIRGLTQYLQQTIGEVVQPKCRAELGDARCKVNLAPLTVSATVTAVTDRRVFSADIGGTVVANHFDNGKITWTSGLNDDYQIEVRNTSGTGPVIGFNLQLPMTKTIQVGDTFSITPGCMKRFIADCQQRFNNVVNFRGEPWVPGPDRLVA